MMQSIIETAPQPAKQAIIESEVRELTSLILNSLPSECQPLSIIWHGGFARGESGLYSYRDRQLPFGDYDFNIVCSQIPSKRIITQLEQKIFDRFGYRPVESNIAETLVDEANIFNVLDFKFQTPDQFLTSPPDIATFDLVNSSKILHGSDLRGDLGISIEQIPLFSAYRILQKRLFNLLSLFHLDLWNPQYQMSHQEKVAFALAICRLWLDFSMALSFTIGCYTTSHKKRLDLLKKEGKELEPLFKDWQGLIQGIEVAIEFKKNPKIETLDAQAIRQGYFLVLESWDSVTRVLLSKLMSYHFGKNHKLDKVDYWSEAAWMSESKFPKMYYREYLKPLVKNRGRWLDTFANLANYYENFGFRGLGFLLRHPRRSKISPEIASFICLPLLAYSLTPLGKVHFGMLNEALKQVLPYRKYQITLTNREHWQEVKDFCIEIFQEYHQKKASIRKLPAWLKK